MDRRVFLTGAAAAATLTACADRQPVDDAAALESHPPVGAFASVDGLAVHYAEAGEGGPPVILLHGASGNLRDWTFSIQEPLADARRVIALDRPGFGYSERGPGRWSPARQAAHLRAAMKQIGVERPILVGHSWGAAVALAWALETPEDVTGVVSIAGATMPWGQAVDMFSAFGLTWYGASRYVSRLSRRGPSGARRFISRVFQPQRPPRGYIDYVGAPLALTERALDATVEDMARIHGALSAQSRRYSDLTVPVEILHGDQDWLLGVARHAAPLAQAAPMARLTVLEGVGHMAHHARTEELAAAIDRLAAG